MKKLLIATAALTLMCGSAFAQTSTGPGAQGDNMTKPGMTKGTMEKGSMDKGSMNKGGTTGMNSGMKNDTNMKANPDATGEGTVGPGSMKK